MLGERPENPGADPAADPGDAGIRPRRAPGRDYRGALRPAGAAGGEAHQEGPGHGGYPPADSPAGGPALRGRAGAGDGAQRPESGPEPGAAGGGHPDSSARLRAGLRPGAPAGESGRGGADFSLTYEQKRARLRFAAASVK